MFKSVCNYTLTKLILLIARLKYNICQLPLENIKHKCKITWSIRLLYIAKKNKF